MNYTNLDRVKQALGAQEGVDDGHLELVIPEASRVIDRLATGRDTSDAIDYFALASVVGEEIKSFVNNRGNLVCYARKPMVVSIDSMRYRTRPNQPWRDINVSQVEFDGSTIEAYGPFARDRYRVQLDYVGGLADDYSQLPADLVNLATVMSVRLYREEKSGLTDTIGVAELGTLQYTAALPARVVQMVQPFVRVVPW